MIAFDLAIRTAASWLAVGLGLFVASGSIRAFRTAQGPAWRVVYAFPCLLAGALVVIGLASFVVAVIGYVSVVPW